MGSVIVLLLTEVCHGQIWQKIDKISFGLSNQRISVRQKQYIFDPALLQQHLHQGNDRTGLSGTGGHDQQCPAAILLSKTVTHSFDRSLLIIAACDCLVHDNVFQAVAHTLKIKQLLQIPPGIECRNLPFRILVIHDTGIEAIGQKHHRTKSLLLLDLVRIQLCLLAAFDCVQTGSFGLDHRQNPPIVADQHIICITRLRLVRDARDLILIDPVLPLNPASVLQHSINIEFSGFVFGNIQRLRDISLLLLSTAGSQFRPKCRIFRHQLFQF